MKNSKLDWYNKELFEPFDRYSPAYSAKGVVRIMYGKHIYVDSSSDNVKICRADVEDITLELIEALANRLTSVYPIKPISITTYAKVFQVSIHFETFTESRLELFLLLTAGSTVCKLYAYSRQYGIALPLLKPYVLDIKEIREGLVDFEEIWSQIIRREQALERWSLMKPVDLPISLINECVLTAKVLKSLRLKNIKVPQTSRLFKKLLKLDHDYYSYENFYIEVCRTIENLKPMDYSFNTEYSIQFGDKYKRKLAALYSISQYLIEQNIL